MQSRAKRGKLANEGWVSGGDGGMRQATDTNALCGSRSSCFIYTDPMPSAHILLGVPAVEERASRWTQVGLVGRQGPCQGP